LIAQKAIIIILYTITVKVVIIISMVCVRFVVQMSANNVSWDIK